jgi:hypothetical protein
MDDTLTPAELARLTEKRTLRQQVVRLVALGIPFRYGGGELSVTRSVATELPQWRKVEAMSGPRLDLVR